MANAVRSFLGTAAGVVRRLTARIAVAEHVAVSTQPLGSAGAAAHRRRRPRTRCWSFRALLIAAIFVYVPLQAVLWWLLQPRPHRTVRSPTIRPRPPIDAVTSDSLDSLGHRPESRFSHTAFWDDDEGLSNRTAAPGIDAGVGRSFAYGFLVHDEETIAGLHDTIAEIWDKRDLFLVHADAKVDAGLYAGLVARYAGVSNVVILEASYDCTWGSVELLHAALALVERALRGPGLPRGAPSVWDYFVLLDGTAFPLQRRAQLRSRLGELAARGAVAVFDETSGRMRTCNPVTSVLNVHICNFHRAHCAGWLDCTRFARAAPAAGTGEASAVWKGTQWVGLPRDFATFATADAVAVGPGGWVEFFGGAFGADEMFFATVAMGRSEFRARLEDAGKLMFKVWSSWGCRSYAPTRRRGVGPCFLGDADWDVLHGAARHDGFLFARKLHSEETALKQRLIDLAAEA